MAVHDAYRMLYGVGVVTPEIENSTRPERLSPARRTRAQSSEYLATALTSRLTSSHSPEPQCGVSKANSCGSTEKAQPSLSTVVCGVVAKIDPVSGSRW